MFYSGFLEEKLPKSASGSHGKLYLWGALSRTFPGHQVEMRGWGPLPGCLLKETQQHAGVLHGFSWCALRSWLLPGKDLPRGSTRFRMLLKGLHTLDAHSIYDHKSLSHPLPKQKHVCANVHGFVKTWKAAALWTVCWGVRIMQSSQGPAQNSRKNLRLENGMAYFPRLK